MIVWVYIKIKKKIKHQIIAVINTVSMWKLSHILVVTHTAGKVHDLAVVEHVIFI